MFANAYTCLLPHTHHTSTYDNVRTHSLLRLPTHTHAHVKINARVFFTYYFYKYEYSPHDFFQPGAIVEVMKPLGKIVLINETGGVCISYTVLYSLENTLTLWEKNDYLFLLMTLTC